MIRELLAGRYEIIAFLKRGGFGHTYLAKDTLLPGQPTCVVKQLHPFRRDPTSLQEAQRLFNLEAESLQKLGKQHNQIPQLFAYFQQKGELYLVEEYIQGTCLAEQLVTGIGLPEEQVVNILEELLEILEFVHRHNAIHRDIKPTNIIRRHEDNKLVLIDFGAVKQVTTQGSELTITIGTPGYMPFEQASGYPNFSSDVYAVGIIGIQALTGINPVPQNGSGFAKDSATQELIWRDRVQVSDEFAEILTKMTRYDYKYRYPSAKEALQAVRALKSNVSTISSSVPSLPLPRSSKEGKILTIGLSVAIITCFAVVLIPVMIQMWQRNSLSSYPRLLLNGKAVSSSLSKEDDFTETNAFSKDLYFRDVYVFEGRKGQQVIIDMISQELDSYLSLRAPDGNQLAANDDISVNDSNARIVVTLPKNGIYKVIASSSQGGETGAYSLRAEAIK
ncbi:protein kinase [Scytonema sp. UIC 10036]|uniref:protein kinase domain-containing protein n=1 Tax=Scytonema sp. UIC 10036 TaxID=2304196 RepID=UPI0012DAB0F6|nr:protein kinase [Scytonema sp. UIC 10036]MUG96183.1 protein kinase [Scytonema sp. UIC 10036]